MVEDELEAVDDGTADTSVGASWLEHAVEQMVGGTVASSRRSVAGVGTVMSSEKENCTPAGSIRNSSATTGVAVEVDTVNGELVSLPRQIIEQVTGGLVMGLTPSAETRTTAGSLSGVAGTELDVEAGFHEPIFSWYSASAAGDMVDGADAVTAPTEAATQLAVDEVLRGGVGVATVMTSEGFDAGAVEPPTRWSMLRLRLRSTLTAGAVRAVAVTAWTRGDVESSAATDGAETMAGVEVFAVVAASTAVAAQLVVEASLAAGVVGAVAAKAFCSLALDSAKLQSRSRASWALRISYVARPSGERLARSSARRRESMEWIEKKFGWIFGAESNGSDANCEVLSTNSLNSPWI